MILQTACFQYTKNQLIINVPMLTMGWDYLKKPVVKERKSIPSLFFPWLPLNTHVPPVYYPIKRTKLLSKLTFPYGSGLVGPVAFEPFWQLATLTHQPNHFRQF